MSEVFASIPRPSTIISFPVTRKCVFQPRPVSRAPGCLQCLSTGALVSSGDTVLGSGSSDSGIERWKSLSLQAYLVIRIRRAEGNDKKKSIVYGGHAGVGTREPKIEVGGVLGKASHGKCNARTLRRPGCG